MVEGGDWDKVGRCVVWQNQIKNCLHQNHVYKIRLNDLNKFDPLWFSLFFNSRFGRAYFAKASKQTTNLASINMRQVKSCPVIIPPIDEQKSILKIIYKFYENIEKMNLISNSLDSLKIKLIDKLTSDLILLNKV